MLLYVYKMKRKYIEERGEPQSQAPVNEANITILTAKMYRTETKKLKKLISPLKSYI